MPYPWESDLSGIAARDYKGAAWYEREITIPLFPTMSDDDVCRVRDTVLESVSSSGSRPATA